MLLQNDAQVFKGIVKISYFFQTEYFLFPKDFPNSANLPLWRREKKKDFCIEFDSIGHLNRWLNFSCYGSCSITESTFNGSIDGEPTEFELGMWKKKISLIFDSSQAIFMVYDCLNAWSPCSEIWMEGKNCARDRWTLNFFWSWFLRHQYRRGSTYIHLYLMATVYFGVYVYLFFCALFSISYFCGYFLS